LGSPQKADREGGIKGNQIGGIKIGRNQSGEHQKSGHQKSELGARRIITVILRTCTVETCVPGQSEAPPGLKKFRSYFFFAFLAFFAFFAFFAFLAIASSFELMD
jgi:hypothetical protein